MFRELFESKAMFLIKNIFKLTSVVSACLCLSACDTEQDGSDSSLGGREVLETGFVVEATLNAPLASNDNNIYWIDDQHVFFKENRENNPNFSGEDEKMHVWNVGSGDVYMLGEEDGKICIREQKIWYANRTDPDDRLSVSQFARPLIWEDQRYRLGEESMVAGFDKHLDLNCNLTTRPGSPGYIENTHILAEFGLRLQPIDDEVEEYKNNRRLGVYQEDNLLKVLSLRERQIYSPNYSIFDESYLFKTGYQPNPRAVGRGGWPREMREISYILNSQIELTEVLLPEAWLNAQSSLFYLTPVGIVSGGYIASSTQENRTRGGLFILRENSIIPVIFGDIYAGAIDRSGCRIAVIYVSRESRNFQRAMRSRTLKVINLCKKEK